MPSVRVTGGSGAGVIRWVEVTWVIPEAGRFGRDQETTRLEATAARVRLQRDADVDEQLATVTEADALLAEAATAAADAKATAAARSAAATAERDEVHALLAALTCPVCGGTAFEEQLSREDGNWGGSSMKLRLQICRRCGYVLHFWRGRSLFGPS